MIILKHIHWHNRETNELEWLSRYAIFMRTQWSFQFSSMPIIPLAEENVLFILELSMGGKVCVKVIHSTVYLNCSYFNIYCSFVAHETQHFLYKCLCTRNDLVLHKLCSSSISWYLYIYKLKPENKQNKQKQ